MSLQFESLDNLIGCNTFGLKSMLQFMPTKQERVLAQERITNKMTDMMSNILKRNGSLELVTKKEIVIKELQHKKLLARSDMVVELIRAGTSTAEAHVIAHAEFPDNR